ncbi:MAG: DUF4286 family protein [Tatlockia sp.]|nr:DUF4286 family protein [Tatlockia sp.]
MVIYEVNLAIEEEIYPQFKLWLKGHIGEMLQFPGFMQATILKPENEDLNGKKKLTVHYQLKNRMALEIYFEKFAAIMREQGTKLFNCKFSSERRIFEIEETISK